MMIGWIEMMIGDMTVPATEEINTVITHTMTQMNTNNSNWPTWLKLAVMFSVGVSLTVTAIVGIITIITYLLLT